MCGRNEMIDAYHTVRTHRITRRAWRSRFWFPSLSLVDSRYWVEKPLSQFPVVKVVFLGIHVSVIESILDIEFKIKKKINSSHTGFHLDFNVFTIKLRMTQYGISYIHYTQVQRCFCFVFFCFCFFFHFLSVVVYKVQVNLQHDLKKKLGTNPRNDEEVI